MTPEEFDRVPWRRGMVATDTSGATCKVLGVDLQERLILVDDDQKLSSECINELTYGNLYNQSKPANQPTAQLPLDVLEELVDATSEVVLDRACYSAWPESSRGQAWAKTRACLTIAEQILEGAQKENQCS